MIQIGTFEQLISALPMLGTEDRSYGKPTDWSALHALMKSGRSAVAGTGHSGDLVVPSSVLSEKLRQRALRTSFLLCFDLYTWVSAGRISIQAPKTAIITSFQEALAGYVPKSPSFAPPVHGWHVRLSTAIDLLKERLDVSESIFENR